MKFFLHLILFAVLYSCSHSVHLVHMSDYELVKDLNQAKKIEVETQQRVIMGFVFETDYVDQAHQKLAAKCRDGKVENITTRYSTSHAFFHWFNKIHMEFM